MRLSDNARHVHEALIELHQAGVITLDMEQRAQKIKPARLKRSASLPTEDDAESFGLFWSVYPRRVGKAQAWREWIKLKPDGALVERIINAVDTWSKSESWQSENGKFVPHPRTFIYNKRWDDEPPQAAQGERKKGLVL